MRHACAAYVYFSTHILGIIYCIIAICCWYLRIIVYKKVIFACLTNPFSKCTRKTMTLVVQFVWTKIAAMNDLFGGRMLLLFTYSHIRQRGFRGTFGRKSERRRPNHMLYQLSSWSMNYWAIAAICSNSAGDFILISPFSTHTFARRSVLREARVYDVCGGCENGQTTVEVRCSRGRKFGKRNEDDFLDFLHVSLGCERTDDMNASLASNRGT